MQESKCNAAKQTFLIIKGGRDFLKLASGLVGNPASRTCATHAD